MPVNLKDEMNIMQGDDMWLLLDKIYEWPDFSDLGWFIIMGAKV